MGGVLWGVVLERALRARLFSIYFIFVADLKDWMHVRHGVLFGWLAGSAAAVGSGRLGCRARHRDRVIVSSKVVSHARRGGLWVYSVPPCFEIDLHPIAIQQKRDN